MLLRVLILVISLGVVSGPAHAVIAGSSDDPALSLSELRLTLDSEWSVEGTLATRGPDSITVTRVASHGLGSQRGVREHAIESGIRVRGEPRAVTLPNVTGLRIVIRLEGDSYRDGKSIIRYYIQSGQIFYIVEAKTSDRSLLESLDALLQTMALLDPNRREPETEEPELDTIAFTRPNGETLSIRVPVMQREPANLRASGERLDLSITRGDFFLRSLDSLLAQLSPEQGAFMPWYDPESGVLISLTVTEASSNEAVEILSTYASSRRRAGRDRVQSLSYRRERISAQGGVSADGHIISVLAPGRSIQVDDQGYRPWSIIAVEHDGVAVLFRLAHKDMSTVEHVAKRNHSRVRIWTTKILRALEFVDE